jgi:gamma-glutamyl:cysteine ligase YbdK (ATP-grasp superfamily)
MNVSKISHGFEQELQIVDPAKGCLLGNQKEILALAEKKILSHSFAGISGEYYGTQIEYRVGICEEFDSLKDGILEYRRIILDCASQLGLALIACGVNPLSRTEREGENFGDHHHVGVQSAEEARHFHNLVRMFIPELIAVSANSPIYNGRRTTFKSFRISRSPHIKLPPFLDSACTEDIINNSFGLPPKKFDRPRFWDVTPFVKSSLPTVEIRLFDAQFSLQNILSIALILQALLLKSRKENWDTSSWNPSNSKWENSLQTNRRAAIEHGIEATFVLDCRPLLKITDAIIAKDACIALFDWLKEEIVSVSEHGVVNYESVVRTLIISNANANLNEIFMSEGKMGYSKYLISKFEEGI